MQGIWKNGDFTGFESTMPMELVERLWGPQPAHTLTVRPKPGVSHAQLASQIEEARLDLHLEARTPGKLAEDSRAEAALFLAPFWALQRALLVVAFAAVLFNLLVVAVQQRREMGLVVAIGMAPGDLAKMIVAEAIGVGIVGALLGTLGAFGIIEGFRNTSFVFLPNEMPFRIDPSAPFVYGAITTVTIVIAAALPAWRAARVQVVDAIRYE